MSIAVVGMGEQLVVGQEEDTTMPLTFDEMQTHILRSLDSLVALGYQREQLTIFVPCGLIPVPLPGFIKKFCGVPIQTDPNIASDTFYIRSPEQ